MTARRKGLSEAAVEYAVFLTGVVEVRNGYRVLKVVEMRLDEAERMPLYAMEIRGTRDA
jgi:hypothetical protein